MNRKVSIHKGSITLFTAAVSVLIVAIIALVTDVGHIYFEHAKLQTAINASWKAGFDKLTEIRKQHKNPTEEDFNIIKNHMMEVMTANGYNHLNSEELRILLTQNKTNLSIEASDEVGLFFMKIFDVQTSRVSAKRAGGAESFSIMPFAIPHGEVHDLSWKTYDYIPFNGNDGFATGTEYIIKLGEQEGDEPLGDEEFMIYIPCGLQIAQTNDARLRAYGAAFWALQIDERDKDSLTPAYWLLSEDGGGFLTRFSEAYEARIRADYSDVQFCRYNASDILNLLKEIGVNLQSKDQINDYLTGIARGEINNSRIVPLTMRPQIAVYSSQVEYDPVEQILRTAKIPYGAYALPKTAQNPSGWDRESFYDASKNSKIFDLEVLNGELDKYDWVHLHHEDFTGLTLSDGSKYNNAVFPTRCQNLKPSCFHNIPVGKISTSVNSQQEADNILYNMACESCLQHMNVVATTSIVVEETVRVYDHTEKKPIYKRGKIIGYKNVDIYRDEKVIKTTYRSVLEDYNKLSATPEYIVANCKREGVTRCGSCGYFNENDLSGQTNFSGCQFYKYLTNKYGYYDDFFAMFPQPFTYSSSQTMQDQCQQWFSSATAYQKMKWEVARLIKDHIMRGGFMYTQCFAAETLDLAIHQGEYYRTRSVSQAYDACLAFTDFKYNQLPKKGGYSSIYSSQNGEATIQTAFKLSPLCQTTGNPNSGAGATSSFKGNVIKTTIDKMAQLNSGSWQYLGGHLINDEGKPKGQFALMGGHRAGNTAAKRYVLDNVMYGSTSDKETSIGTHLAGRTKYQYGCIDLDNDGQKSSSDYINRLLYGFDSPINFADIISTDNGKYTKETEDSTEVISGKKTLEEYTPNQIVIVPIIGTPESVQRYQAGIQRPNDQQIEQDDITIYDIKVGAVNNGAEDYDNLDSKYLPSEVGYDSLKNSVQIIGFAKFRIMSPDEYTRSDVLGEPLSGQIRGEFLEYIVDPREVRHLLTTYNSQG